MESNPRKDDAPDGQMDMDDMHEGVPYTINPDGSVTMGNADDDLPEFEDPFAEKKDVPDEDLPY